MIHGSPDLSWTQVPFWIGHILQDAETVNLFDVPGAKIQEKSGPIRISPTVSKVSLKTRVLICKWWSWRTSLIAFVQVAGINCQVGYSKLSELLCPRICFKPLKALSRAVKSSSVVPSLTLNITIWWAPANCCQHQRRENLPSSQWLNHWEEQIDEITPIQRKNKPKSHGWLPSAFFFISYLKKKWIEKESKLKSRTPKGWIISYQGTKWLTFNTKHQAFGKNMEKCQLVVIPHTLPPSNLQSSARDPHTLGMMRIVTVSPSPWFPHHLFLFINYEVNSIGYSTNPIDLQYIMDILTWKTEALRLRKTTKKDWTLERLQRKTTKGV